MPVQCKDCGYFAIREFQSRNVICVERSQRETGDDPYKGRGGVKSNLCEDVPFCFRQSYAIHEEAAGEKSKFVATSNCERDCDSNGVFTYWVEGLTPKEHMAMDILERWQERQESRIEAERQWRERVDKENREWRQQQEQMLEARHQESMRMHWKEIITLGLVAGGFVGLCTIIAAFISKS